MFNIKSPFDNVQELKNELNNIKLQIDNIANMNFMINPLFYNELGDKLMTLSIQIINIGIQAFDIGSNMIYNNNNRLKYYPQLKNISDKINTMIAPNIFPFIQLNQEFMNPNQNVIFQEKPKRNVFFRRSGAGIITIAIDEEKTIKELIDMYMDKAYGFENSSIYFLLNNEKLGRNDLTKIRENWGSSQITIDVFEIGSDIL